MSSTKVTCFSPPQWFGGRCKVEVSCNGGHDYTSNGMFYEYEGRSFVSEIEPALGPDIGGSLVIIKGGKFTALNSYVISCSFGPSGIVPGTIVSDNRISCISPPLVTNNFTSVTLELITSNGKLNGNYLGEDQIMYMKRYLQHFTGMG